MARLIDAEQFEKELREMWLDLHGRRPPLKHPVTLKKIRTLLKKQGELECIPVDWLIDYEIANGTYVPLHDAVDDWRREHGKAD